MNILIRKKIIFPLFLVAAVCSSSIASIAQENNTFEASPGKEELGSDLYYFYTDEYMNVKVDVASLFEEDEMVTGSSVSRITSAEWKKFGARRMHEALNNELGVMAYPMPFGSYAIAIRGYANSQTMSNVAVTLDGVPLNDVASGTAFYSIPNWNLGTLDTIELIKGPGSAIYGSDAFSGVISMKAFESKQNHYSAEVAGAYPEYGDANIKISQGIAGNLVRIDATAAASRQNDQDIEYEYDDGGITGTGKRDNKYDSQSGVLKITYSPFDKLKVHAGMYANYWNCRNFLGFAAAPNNLRDKDTSESETFILIGNGSVVYYFDNSISVEAQGYSWKTDMDSEAVTSPDGTYLATENTNSRSGFQLIVKQPVNPFNVQWLLAYSYTHYRLDKYDMMLKDSNDNVMTDITDREAQGFSRDINSAFGQLKWGVIKNTLYFLLGGRMDYYSDFGNQNTPRGGIIFIPAETFSIKALYGRAFKAPNASQLFGVPSIIEEEPDLKPETIDIYELIFMLKGKKWKSTVSGFYSLWKNGIIAQPVESSTLAKYVNKGENTSYGCELSLYLSADPIAAEGGFSYIKSKALDVVNADDPSIVEDQEYRAFPELTYSVGIYYTMKPYDIIFYLNNRLFLDMTENPLEIKDDPELLPAYCRMDFNISKAFSDKLDVYLDIRNLLNRKNYIPSLMGAPNGYEEPGISVLLRAGYHL